MSNDFQLFPDTGDEDPAVDADIAFVTAYLARELSLVQIVAVEERLATDAAFLTKVRPIIEGWVVPGESGLSGARVLPTTLTADEIEGGWQRRGAQGVAAGAWPRGTAHTRAVAAMRSRVPVRRIAAVIALTVMPMIAFAQAVRYAARHPDAPGHTLAKRITQSIAPSPPAIDETRAGRSLTLPEQQVVPVVDLPAATAMTTRTMGAILGLAQTTDGAVFVNDPVRRQVLRFEPDLHTWSMVLDSVPGTSKSYGSVDTLVPQARRVLMPYLGDSAVFGPVGAANNTALVIDGNGTLVHALSSFPTSNGPAFWDSQGRIVISLAPMERLFMATYRDTEGGDNFASLATRRDSILIVRRIDATPAALPAAPAAPAAPPALSGGRLPPKTFRPVDTLGYLLQPEDRRPGLAGVPYDVQHVGNGGGRLVPVTGPDGVVCWREPGGRGVLLSGGCKNTAKQIVNPLYFVDAWALLSDGTVAIVRGQDYHVDWVKPDGTKSASPKLPFDWRRVSDADKQRIVDSTRAAIDSLDRLATIEEEKWKGWKDSVAAHARASGARVVKDELAHVGLPERVWPYDIVPLSQIADYYPPFRSNAARPDADGNLWILPRTTLSRRGELVYDIVNPTRGLVQRVRLPVGRSIAGFGKGGVVYLQFGDLKNGFILERSTLPAPIPK